MISKEEKDFIRECHDGQIAIFILFSSIFILISCLIGCAGTDLTYDLDNNGILSTGEQVVAGANITADTLTDSGIPYLEIAGSVLGLGMSVFGVRRYRKNTAVINGMSQMIEMAKENMDDSRKDIFKRQITEFVNINKIAKETKKIKERINGIK